MHSFTPIAVCSLLALSLCSVACAPQGYAYDSVYQTQSAEDSAGFLQDLQTIGSVPEAPLNSLYGAPNAFDGAASQPIVTKRFFIHSAPEEEEEPIKETHLTIGKSRRNFNVVFIKAPVKAAGKATVRITPAVNEDKTVIYVLAKKPEEPQIETHVHEPVTTTAKPEVYFIKYQTQAEAEHAQRNIQAQYDHLGGSSLVSHEGVPAVHSVIGSLGNEQAGEEQHSATDGHAGNQYLPPRKY